MSDKSEEVEQGDGLMEVEFEADENENKNHEESIEAAKFQEYKKLKRDWEKKKQEFAQVNVGRLYDLMIPRTIFQREMVKMAELKAVETSYIKFKLAKETVDMVHDFVETQIHLYLEAATHVMSIDFTRELHVKHLYVVERLSAFTLPWLKCNKYQKYPVYVRDEGMEKARTETENMLNLYTHNVNTLNDPFGKFRVINQEEVTSWPQQRRRQHLFFQNHYAQEKRVKAALQEAKAKLDTFRETHGDLFKDMLCDEDADNHQDMVLDDAFDNEQVVPKQPLAASEKRSITPESLQEGDDTDFMDLDNLSDRESSDYFRKMAMGVPEEIVDDGEIGNVSENDESPLEDDLPQD